MLMKIQKHVMQKRNNTRTKLYTPSDFQMLVDEILSPIPLPLLPADPHNRNNIDRITEHEQYLASTAPQIHSIYY